MEHVARCNCATMNWKGGESGERGIRTLGTGLNPYNGLANRPLQPLGHLSGTIHSCYRPLRAKSNSSSAPGDRTSIVPHSPISGLYISRKALAIHQG